MLRTNATLRLLRADEPAVGTWLQLHSVHAARLLAAQGFFRWMLVDFGHTPVDNLTATRLFSTISDISAGEITPLVSRSDRSRQSSRHSTAAHRA
jgi:2-keto-3-deoxy-L-rhamnonate aldolase RhmA